MFRVEPLTPRHVESWAELFAATGHDCFCQYWHFRGSKNEWLERCAFDGKENRALAERGLATEDGTSRGLVAIESGGESDRVVGWMKLARLAVVPKLRQLPVYRQLPLDGDPAPFAIACVLVHPEARRKGVARVLVESAEAFVRAWGGTSVLAFPYRTAEETNDTVFLMGPEAAYRDAGFTCAFDIAPYPVWRKAIERDEPSIDRSQ